MKVGEEGKVKVVTITERTLPIDTLLTATDGLLLLITGPFSLSLLTHILTHSHEATVRGDHLGEQKCYCSCWCRECNKAK